MKIEVSEYEKKYTFELAPVTQLCGQNIKKKTYVLESIRRYFSTYRYREEKNKWRDNVKIDDEILGRKFLTVITVKDISEVLQMIMCSKKSLMLEYVKQLLQKFDLQMHMRTISEELEKIFQVLNEDMYQLGKVELSYEMSDVWDMIQKSNIIGTDQMMLDDKENDELLMIFLNLLEEIMKFDPKKMIIIIENIDHLISKKQYGDILEKMQNMGKKYDLYFIVSTSLDGYVKCTDELCSGITVFGEVDFQMPEFEEIVNYIHDYYPCNKKLSPERIEKDLIKIIQKIGQNHFLYGVEENVICKLINQTLMLHEKWENIENQPEIAFLKA